MVQPHSIGDFSTKISNSVDKTVGSRVGISSYMRAEKLEQEFDKECKKSNPLPYVEFFAKIAHSSTGETVYL